jgi:glutathione synthase/RimK-type ligase-like ATP-grasp enzyme
MKLAIHKSNDGFHPQWIEYCKKANIDVKLVNCYDNNIIGQLDGCNALMWHFSQNHPSDVIVAKQIIQAIEQSGKKVFPNYNTSWHFDDKVAQKYLMEGLGLPIVPSYVFYSKSEAEKWIERNEFPKVFKLRGGAGSSNVSLAYTRADALRLVKKAFGSGFKNYNGWDQIMDTFRLYRLGKATILNVIKVVYRSIFPPKFSKILGRELGYAYFQDFIPNNDHDIRVIVIGEKAFAIKRMVRANDFRASGSGHILYDKDHFDLNTIQLAFDASTSLKSQCTAFDFVYQDGRPLIVEISYGFAPKGYVNCPGYWDSSLKWHEGSFNPYGWMVDIVR